MTKKDYIAAARILHDIKSPSVRGAASLAFSRLFQEDNPHFDVTRWNEAVEGGTVRARAGTRSRPLT